MEWDHNHNKRYKNRLMSFVFAVLWANCRRGGVFVFPYWPSGENASFVNLTVVEGCLNQKSYKQELKKYVHSLQSYMTGIFSLRFFCGESLLEPVI
jgi:hypothetical protein